MDAGIVSLLRVLVIAAIAAAVIYFVRVGVSGIRAPVQVELNAARGNNAALKASGDVQNAATDAMKVETDQRKAKSRDAVGKAGKPELAAAQRILAKPAPGQTPLERAANRINAEFSR